MAETRRGPYDSCTDSTILRPLSMSKGDDAAALPPPRRSYMRGARLLLGTAMAGSRMAAATESEAMSVVAQRILLIAGRAARTKRSNGVGILLRLRRQPKTRLLRPVLQRLANDDFAANTV